jgi:hypothetical protein
LVNFDSLINKINESFKLNVQYEIDSDVLLLKLLGIDNCSLARWIVNEFDNIKVEVKELEGYKFSNDGWIRIEKYEGKLLNLKR